MGLLDALFGGGQQQPQGGLLGTGGNNSLYGDLLTPPQQQALQQRASQGGLLALANSGALNYEAPFLSGRVPGGFAKALAAYSGGQGEGEDKGILNALNARLTGLKGADLKSQMDIRQKLLGILPGLLGGDSGAVPSTSGPSTASPLGDGLLAAPAADTGEGGPGDPRGLVPYIKLKAQQYGVDPDLAVKVAGNEGLRTFLGDGGKSGGAFQLYTGGGEGNNFQKETGLDPLDPKNERATIDYALRRVAEGGWGPWNGAKALGITGMMGVDPSKALGTPPPQNLAGTAAGVADLQPQGLLSQAGPQDAVAPQVNGTGGAPITRAQLGGQPGLLSQPAPPAASPITMPQQPRMPFGGNQPSGALSNGIDPRRLAVGGVLAQLGGIGDVMKPLESYYYQSPGYLQQAEGAKSAGQFPFQAGLETHKTNEQIRAAGPVARAQNEARVGPELQIAGGKAELDRESERLKQKGLAAGDIVKTTYGGREMDVTREQAARIARGEGVPELGIPSLQPGGAAPAAQPGGALGKPVFTPEQITRGNSRATAEEKARETILAQADKAAQSRASLLNIEAEAGNFTQGPFAPYAQKAASILRTINPKFDGQVGSYEAFEKNAGVLIRQAVRETDSNPAVQQFNMIRQSLPNPETSPVGLRKIMPQLIGVRDYEIASGQAVSKYEEANSGSSAGFQTWWQKNASPYAFMVARMHGDDRKELIAKLQSSEQGRRELAKLGEQLSFLKQSGLAD